MHTCTSHIHVLHACRYPDLTYVRVYIYIYIIYLFIYLYVGEVPHHAFVVNPLLIIPQEGELTGKHRSTLKCAVFLDHRW